MTASFEVQERVLLWGGLLSGYIATAGRVKSRVASVSSSLLSIRMKDDDIASGGESSF